MIAISQILFENTSLYYFLSTMAQVLAAAVAIIAIFVQFRINTLKNFLIGDGSSLFQRWDKYNESYKAGTSQRDRLRDALDRESISGIQQQVDYLAKKEKEAGVTLDQRPRGLQYAQKRFKRTRQNIKDLISKSRWAFTWALITAVFSTSSIIFVDLVEHNLHLKIVIIVANLLLLIWCSVLLWRGMNAGLQDPGIRFKDNIEENL